MADQPWLANREWASGRLSDQAQQQGPFGYAFATIICGVVGVTSIALTKGNPFFVTAGIAILILGFIIVQARRRAMRRARRFQSILVLDTLPGTIGGAFRGHVEITTDMLRFRQAKTVQATLS